MGFLFDRANEEHSCMLLLRSVVLVVRAETYVYDGGGKKGHVRRTHMAMKPGSKCMPEGTPDSIAVRCVARYIPLWKHSKTTGDGKMKLVFGEPRQRRAEEGLRPGA